jgi:Arc/MetJ family transcription regulator
MKRTNVVLDEELLAEAQRVSGERTYSATIARALRELVARVAARGILQLQGSGLWQGELAEMRGDSPRRPARAAKFRDPAEVRQWLSAPREPWRTAGEPMILRDGPPPAGWDDPKPPQPAPKKKSKRRGPR